VSIFNVFVHGLFKKTCQLIVTC